MKITRSLIDKYNVAVPRYTSYPPANHFHDISAGAYLNMIESSNTAEPENIAFYIHIPFCKKICSYCGCNAEIYKNDALTEAYIDALKSEIMLVASRLDKKRKVSQIHYGGGTPNAIDPRYTEEINQLFFDLFDFIPQPEIAIECHPGLLDELYLQRLLNARFNRFSLGIQDFNTEVLDAVNRAPAALPVEEIVAFLKADNPRISVNLDFIYGLPGQTAGSFLDTIRKAIAIHPDRLVTFSYAHVPWMKKHQQILEKKGLLSSEDKMDIFLTSRALLLESGYEPVGLDHYVLPEDELNIALNNNGLHRNFQGYCTRRTTGQVYAFGVSAISQLDGGYVQNTKSTEQYIQTLRDKKLPSEKGMELTTDQKLISTVIENIMCNKKLDISYLCDAQNINKADFLRITGFNETKLSSFTEDDLVHFEDDVLTITKTGSFFIRNIAAMFDPAYQAQEFKYSKSV